MLLNLLSVRLHVALLKVGGEAVHVLVVREQGVRLGTEEVAVPSRIKFQGYFI